LGANPKIMLIFLYQVNVTDYFCFLAMVVVTDKALLYAFLIVTFGIELDRIRRSWKDRNHWETPHGESTWRKCPKAKNDKNYAELSYTCWIFPSV